MKIYTKKGDKGETQLLGGTKVKKTHVQLEAFGTIDELNAHIGYLHDQDISKKHKSSLFTIQDQLLKLGSNIALDKSKKNIDVPEITKEDIRLLEKSIDSIESKLAPLKVFILPSGHHTASLCHIARTICRRAERRIVELHNKSALNDIWLQYINRLSDYLFVLSRALLKEKSVNENRWH